MLFASTPADRPRPCRKLPVHPRPAGRQQRLQGEAEAALAEAEALKLQARLEDLTVWQMEKVKQSRKGSKTYTYWMASWREGGKTRNVHLGSARKMDAEEASQKAREMKAEALGYRGGRRLMIVPVLGQGPGI